MLNRGVTLASIMLYTRKKSTNGIYGSGTFGAREEVPEVAQQSGY